MIIILVIKKTRKSNLAGSFFPKINHTVYWGLLYVLKHYIIIFNSCIKIKKNAFNTFLRDKILNCSMKNWSKALFLANSEWLNLKSKISTFLSNQIFFTYFFKTPVQLAQIVDNWSCFGMIPRLDAYTSLTIFLGHCV